MDQVNYWMEKQTEHEYLKEVDGDKAISWVKESNQKSVKAIGEPTENPLYEKVLSIMDSKDKIPYVRKIGTYYYNFWRDADHKRGLWRRTTLESYSASDKDIAWETVLDVDKLCADEGESWVWQGHNVYFPVDLSIPPTRTLLYLSRGGSDAKVCREFDLALKAFVPTSNGSGDCQYQGFYIPEAKSQVSWVDENTLMVGTDLKDGVSMTDSGYPRVNRLWKRGTSLETESVVCYEGENQDVSVNAYLSHHHGIVTVWRTRSLTFYTSVYSLCIIPPGSTGSMVDIISDEKSWKVLGDLPADVADVNQMGSQLLITLRTPWETNYAQSNSVQSDTAMHTTPPPARQLHGEGSVLSVDMLDFVENGSNSTTFTVLYSPSPDGRTSLNSTTITKNYVIFETLENVKSRLHFWRFDPSGSTDVNGGCMSASRGSWVFVGSEEESVTRGLSISAVDSDENDRCWLTVNSFLTPSTLYIVDANDGPVGISKALADANAKLKQLPVYFDASNLEEFQMEATSQDGTKVPYFVVRTKRKENEKVVPVPTILYGYGGFEISILPTYQAVTGVAWLESGGCYVVANIRGGGEFGPSWHQAALKERRHKCYEDFIAVAEHLISSGITTSRQLGIRGGSNGGLLLGNMFVMRPDLFGAVACAVPLLDMKCFNKLLAGASWMAEYGDPDTDDWMNFLHRYSPYHNIDPKRCIAPTPDRVDGKSVAPYPALFMSTSTRDDRVHPYHARCFVKRLEELGMPSDRLLYYENMEGGHSGAADNKQQAFMTVLYIEFLYKTICKA